MTEQELKDIGFVKEKTYKHDVFTTNRYVKGVLEVEFTYEGTKLQTVDVTIEEINCMPVTLYQIAQLDTIINTKVSHA